MFLMRAVKVRGDAVTRQCCNECFGVYLVECFFPVGQDGVK